MKQEGDRLFLYRTNADDYPWSPRSGPEKDRTEIDLLRLIRRHSPLSRADLVRLSGLTAPTVSAGVAKLARRALVVELGPGNSSGGRPPALMEFNAQYGYVIGADLDDSVVRLALADLNGTVLGKWQSALGRDRTPEAVTEIIGNAVWSLLEKHRIPNQKVLELVAGAPGITNVASGQVLSAPNLTGWRNVAFRDLLQNTIGIPVTVENDVKLGALGESWHGVARNTANFVFLAVGAGVGAGIVLNNVLHHGANWSAGEVGYLLMPGLPGEPLAADRPGALESAVGSEAIERAWAETGSLPKEGKSLRTTEIFDLARAGNNRANALLEHIAQQLEMAVTNLSLILDLSLVVLSGGVGGHDALLQAIRRKLERNEFARPQLAMSSLGGEAQIHGAIWLGLQAAAAAGFRRRPIETVIAVAVNSGPFGKRA
jgi:glucokinase